MIKQKKFDITRKQVITQLNSMSCNLYELQPIPPKGSSLNPHKIRVVSTDEIISTLPRLKAVNAKGYDIYLRPAPNETKESNISVDTLVFIDDISQEIAEKMEADGFQFASLIESSPKNFQGWIRLSKDQADPLTITTAAKLLADRYGGDPHSASWRHYGRLAGFTNQKPKHTNSAGKQPFSKLIRFSSSVAPAGSELLLEVEMMLLQQPKKEASKTVRKTSSPFIDNFDRLQIDAAFAFRQALAKSSGKNASSDDFYATLQLLNKGYSIADVKRALAECSPDIVQRHPATHDYINRTVNFSYALSLRNRGADPADIKAELTQMAEAEGRRGVSQYVDREMAKLQRYTAPKLG